MNLFAYTKQLADQIAFYDSIANIDYTNNLVTNPFRQPVNITIIWVDGKENSD